MAKLQALKQQRALETTDAPVSSYQVEGGFSGGVPKMHPLKSSGPIFKATRLLHSLHVKKIKMPGGGGGLKLPHLPKI